MSHQHENDGAAEDGPVSKLELLRLRQQDRPALTFEYNLDGTAETRKLDQLRARWRANYIEERLKKAEGRADKAFTKARLTSRARHGFERSR